MFTSSLAWTPSPASVAITSFAFMFDEVPEPVENVDRELVVELAVRDAVGGGGDPVGLLAVEQAEVGVHVRRGTLDPAEPARDQRRIGSPETGKLATAFAVSPPQSSCCPLSCS